MWCQSNITTIEEDAATIEELTREIKQLKKDNRVLVAGKYLTESEVQAQVNLEQGRGVEAFLHKSMAESPHASSMTMGTIVL